MTHLRTWRGLGQVILASALLTAAAAPYALGQRRPPVLDMHFHALAAADQGPPPLALCIPPAPSPHDPRDPWGPAFIRSMKEPVCADPVWSPVTDAALRDSNLAVIERHNVYGVLSGPPARVQAWRESAPNRFWAGHGFRLGPDAASPDSLRALRAAGHLDVLAEVTNQYAGISPSDPAFEPYLAMAEELDMPVGIHIGTGPPGAGRLVPTYRARLHSALTLEEALQRHPQLRVYIMHAGWPMIDDLLAVLWTYPDVYVEVGAIVWALPRAEFYRFLQRIVDAGFGQRVMFGSDQMVWPGVIARAIEIIEDAPFLTAEQKRDILYNNAARFLRLSDEEIARHHGRIP